MKTYMQKAMTFIRDEEGASAVEYALLVGLIAVVITVGVGAFGKALNEFFQGLPAKLGIG